MEHFKFGRNDLQLSGILLDRNVRPVNFNHIIPFEPARNNRFILNTIGVNIPPYFIQNYTFTYENNTHFFEVNFIDAIGTIFRPNYIENITGFTLELLDPAGIIYNRLHIDVLNCLEYSKSGDYSSDVTTTNYAKFTVIVNVI